MDVEHHRLDHRDCHRRETLDRDFGLRVQRPDDHLRRETDQHIGIAAALHRDMAARAVAAGAGHVLDRHPRLHDLVFLPGVLDLAQEHVDARTGPGMGRQHHAVAGTPFGGLCHACHTQNRCQYRQAAPR